MLQCTFVQSMKSVMFTTGVLTISDKGSRGERIDKSGEEIKKLLATLDSRPVKYDIVPDEVDIIAARLSQWADLRQLSL
jgi:molybdopterin adenylyltransferase